MCTFLLDVKHHANNTPLYRIPCKSIAFGALVTRPCRIDDEKNTSKNKSEGCIKHLNKHFNTSNRHFCTGEEGKQKTRRKKPNRE